MWPNLAKLETRKQANFFEAATVLCKNEEEEGNAC